MSEKGIAQFLVKHAAENPVSFHMPGHKGRNIYEQYGCKGFNGDLLPFDITEIPGADNLFLTEGIIRATAEKYAKLYEVKKSYLLVNGTSCGLIAAIMATAGSKLIMARNCHKSVFSGLRLAGVSPVYAFPSVIPEYGISGPVEPEEIERLLKENPDAGAVILPSPNYYGICSDVKAIAKVCHAHEKVLIVDQAHGAHLKMFNRFAKELILDDALKIPFSAEECGADIVVNSIHKTLLSFTQSAILNVNSNRVDQILLEDKLQMLESTSPSYLLMASLDLNADIMLEHGKELCNKWLEGLYDFYKGISKVPGVRVMKPQELMDSTKINIDMSGYGIDGNQLEQILNEKGIYPELVTGNILMCMTGVGNTPEDLQKLADALTEIVKESTRTTSKTVANGTEKVNGMVAARLWNKRRKLYEIPDKKKQLNIELCAGKICATSIIPYPPGIPLICPGEEISADDIEYIKFLRKKGEKVIGFGTDDTLFVGV